MLKKALYFNEFHDSSRLTPLLYMKHFFVLKKSWNKLNWITSEIFVIIENPSLMPDILIIFA